MIKENKTEKMEGQKIPPSNEGSIRNSSQSWTWFYSRLRASLSYITNCLKNVIKINTHTHTPRDKFIERKENVKIDQIQIETKFKRIT